MEAEGKPAFQEALLSQLESFHVPQVHHLQFTPIP